MGFTVFCKKCGKELPDSAEFCSRCGTKTVPVRDYNEYDYNEQRSDYQRQGDADYQRQGDSQSSDPLDNLYYFLESVAIKLKEDQYHKYIGIAAIVSFVSGVTGIGWSGFIIVSLLAVAGLIFLWYKKMLDNRLYLSIILSVYMFRFLLIDFQTLVLSDTSTYAWYVYVLRVLEYGLVAVYWLYSTGKLKVTLGSVIVTEVCALLGLYEIFFILTNLSYSFRTIMTCVSSLAFYVAFILLEGAEISRNEAY